MLWLALPQQCSGATTTHHALHLTLEIHSSNCTSQITHHTSHITHHTSHITYRTSHITHHTSHIAHHTSHVMHHTIHLTPLAPRLIAFVPGTTSSTAQARTLQSTRCVRSQATSLCPCVPLPASVSPVFFFLIRATLRLMGSNKLMLCCLECKHRYLLQHFPSSRLLISFLSRS